METIDSLFIKDIFYSLVQETHPHGFEKDLIKYFPKKVKTDSVGNYYIKIGNKNPKIMFTSHLDTYGKFKRKVVTKTKIINGEEYVFTDGKTILGADDKAGVTLMLYMIKNNIPGLYYFFIGEEKTGIGAKELSNYFYKIEYLKNIKICVSFDRRNTTSVIINQLGKKCCSNIFAEELCNMYNKFGLDLSPDPTGICTDSAFFMDKIRECTNISVGYYNEHTKNEFQNMTYLIKLCKASLNVDWESLPIIRRID